MAVDLPRDLAQLVLATLDLQPTEERHAGLVAELVEVEPAGAVLLAAPQLRDRLAGSEHQEARVVRRQLEDERRDRRVLHLARLGRRRRLLERLEPV